MICLNMESEILPTPPLIFMEGEGKKVQHLVLKGSGFQREQNIGHLKQTCWGFMRVLCFYQIWYSSVYAPLRTTPDEIARVIIWRRQGATSSITQPRLFRFRSNLVQSLMHDTMTTFKVKCQRSRSQRENVWSTHCWSLSGSRDCWMAISELWLEAAK